MSTRALRTGPAVGLLVVGALLAFALHRADVGGHGAAPPVPEPVREARLRAQLEDRGHPLPLGEVVSWILLRDEHDRARRHELPADGRPVVIWFWSCLCRCVRDCEERIVALLEKYPEERVHFFAVASNPDDTAHDIHKLRMSMGSPYPVYRDVHGATARHLGVDASASVAVLDGEGRIRFRGAIDDDLYEPTVNYVDLALAAIFAGKPVEPTGAPSYGCRYPRPEPLSR